MIILTLIGIAAAPLDSFVLDRTYTSNISDFMNPFDIDLFDYDAEEETHGSNTDKEPSRKQQDIPDQGHSEIQQQVIEV